MDKRAPYFVRLQSQQLETLRLFHEVAGALASNINITPMLQAIMGKMQDFFAPQYWTLMLIDEEKDELYTVFSQDARSANIEHMHIRLKLGQGIAGKVAKYGEPLIIDDVNKDAEWKKFARAHPELQLKSFACLPILYGRKCVGVLQVNNADFEILPNASLAVLRVLCDYAAIAIENSKRVELIHHLSITDDCTGLFNARYMYQMLEEQIDLLRGEGEFSLVFLDLDYFKSVNDEHGHQIGTRLLAEVGSLIKRTLGPEHMAFRYGGDEFVLLLRDANKLDGMEITEHLKTTLAGEQFLTAAGLQLMVRASYGLATYPEDGSTLQGIIRSADTMMYAAKAQGRDRICVATPEALASFPVPKTSRHT